MNFGQALEALEDGNKIARVGWNGKGMWVELIKFHTHTPIKDGMTMEPFFVIKNVKDTFNTWVPSVADLLAKDYVVVMQNDK